MRICDLQVGLAYEVSFRFFKAPACCCLGTHAQVKPEEWLNLHAFKGLQNLSLIIKYSELKVVARVNMVATTCWGIWIGELTRWCLTLIEFLARPWSTKELDLKGNKIDLACGPTWALFAESGGLEEDVFAQPLVVGLTGYGWLWFEFKIGNGLIGLQGWRILKPELVPLFIVLVGKSVEGQGLFKDWKIFSREDKAWANWWGSALGSLGRPDCELVNQHWVSVLMLEVEFREWVIACKDFVIVHNYSADLECLVVWGSFVVVHYKRKIALTLWVSGVALRLSKRTILAWTIQTKQT